MSTSLGAVSFERLEAIYRLLPERLGRIPGVDERRLLALRPDGGEQLDRADHRRRPWLVRTAVGLVEPGQPALLRDHRYPAGARPVPGRARHARRAAPIAVVSETFAATVFRRQPIPIGKRFGFADRNGEGARVFEIVGSGRRTRNIRIPRRPAYATFFLPFLQQPPGLPDAQRRGALQSNIVRSIQLRDRSTGAGTGRSTSGAPSRTSIRASPCCMSLALGDQVSGNFRMDRLIVTLATGFLC